MSFTLEETPKDPRSLNAGVKRSGAAFDFAEEESMAPTANKFQRVQTCYAGFYRNKMNPGLNLERGQIQDFKHELHYILTTIFDEKASQNLKSLSLTQLTKKATTSQFRNFLRTQTIQMERLFGVLSELTSSPVISLTSSCFLYFMARDQKSVPISENCFHLLSELLKQDSQRSKMEEENQKHADTILSIMKDWLNNTESLVSKSIQFDVSLDNLSSSYLALESLAFMAVTEHNSSFKSALLSSGCLTSVIAKLDKVVLELVHSNVEVMARLKIVERSFRILENAAAFDKKNQIFLIQHRNSLLIFSCAKFLNFSSKFLESRQSFTEQGSSQNENNQIFECVCLLCRVMMNISHENENASLKLGQIAGFLGNCLALLASHSLNAPKNKFFDVCCMMYGLLVNLLEKCPANRRKFITLKANFVDINGQCVSEVTSIEILTKLFIKHDSAAKTIDEELDNELVAEEPDEEDGGGYEQRESGSTSSLTSAETTEQTNGVLGRGEVSMSEDEIIAAIQSAMNKASAHMEDSMIASYCSLVIAILVGSDEKLATQVSSLLPNGEVKPMVEQLERFLEFMQITKKLKENTVKSVERLIKTFELATTTSSN